MKSKCAELFTAKLNDMDLVLFEKHKGWCKWSTAHESDRYFMVSDNFEYFLCLPQHKEVCLHWLNGGDVQAIHFENQMPDSGVMFDSDFVDLEDEVSTYPWKDNHIFMQDHEIKIKPKKEKRWIATFPWSGNAFYVTPESFASEFLLNDYVDMHYGRRELMVTHEIEVEV